jgi:hypothetical protein
MGGGGIQEKQGGLIIGDGNLAQITIRGKQSKKE